MNVSRKQRTRSYATGTCRCVTLAVLATAIFGLGCDTPYTRRIKLLDDAYQRGDLSREDYMRFAHDAELWEAR
jgi:hypothetical protein